MEINEALELDNAAGSEVLLTLDKILQQLEAFRSRYPQTFQHLCEQAIATGEMSLGDGLSALAWVTDALMQGE
jgi:hypothetical protein